MGIRAGLLPDSLTLTPFIKQGATGPIYGPERIIKGRIQTGLEGATGGQVSSENYRALIFVAPNEAIPLSSKLLWLDPVTGATVLATVHKVDTIKTTATPHHLEVYVK